MKADLPENEQERLHALDAYAILDTLPEQAYDDIVLLASQIVQTPIALISLIDEERQWFKAKIGLDTSETHRDLAFCAHAIHRPDEPLIVRDATEDSRFADNPLVLQEPNIRFYAGATLTTSDGYALGTLCVIDRVPREPSLEQINALSALSRQVISQLELRRLVDKLQHTTKELETHQDRLKNYQKQLEEANEELSQASSTDSLTGLMNRRAFDHFLDQEYDRAQRYGASMAILLIDVDQFKEYNDTHGHPAGDEALRAVATILAKEIRKSDVVCRYGGEEFAAVLVNADEDTAHILAERVRNAVESADWALRPITVSVGLAALDQTDIERSRLVADADRALYAAKDSGRNCTVSSKNIATA